ncbi:hypothetical protein, partial [Sulfolobus acidocaldarius]
PSSPPPPPPRRPLKYVILGTVLAVVIVVGLVVYFSFFSTSAQAKIIPASSVGSALGGSCQIESNKSVQINKLANGEYELTYVNGTHTTTYLSNISISLIGIVPLRGSLLQVIFSGVVEFLNCNINGQNATVNILTMVFTNSSEANQEFSIYKAFASLYPNASVSQSYIYYSLFDYSYGAGVRNNVFSSVVIQGPMIGENQVLGIVNLALS